ncbi:MAG TPA: hypothetical protein VHX42_03355 [Candidatus Babeliales bacterium]|jgi:hypothetical protein|nr:hypothetical protein [Candidatus Babeliales bacterium]
MTINGTLLVQAFNFIIVYWMLRIFLFKPVISIIEHEKKQENSMLDIIDQQLKSLEFQEKERRRHWYICQEYFKIHQPSLSKDTLILADNTKNDLEIPVTATPDIARIIADIQSVIEEKIKHVQ